MTSLALLQAEMVNLGLMTVNVPKCLFWGKLPKGMRDVNQFLSMIEDSLFLTE